MHTGSIFPPRAAHAFSSSGVACGRFGCRAGVAGPGIGPGT
jgi:hypothetical protein